MVRALNLTASKIHGAPPWCAEPGYGEPEEADSCHRLLRQYKEIN